MIDPKYEAALVKAFRDLHACEAKYTKTVPVTERWKGKTVWEGDVEVFALSGRPTVSRGYAWAFDKAKGSEIVAILEVPPVISPETAVQAAVVMKWKEETARKDRCKGSLRGGMKRCLDDGIMAISKRTIRAYSLDDLEIAAACIEQWESEGKLEILKPIDVATDEENVIKLKSFPGERRPMFGI